MIVPQRAPVKPRVISPDTGEAVPLEEEILSYLETGRPGIICVIGPPGSGKTTALRHLAAVLPSGAPVRLWDNGPGPPPAPGKGARLVVYTGKSPFLKTHRAVLPLTSWQADDAIDYLLAAHNTCCASVMTRLRAAPDRDLLDGTAELWRVVLDQMAADATIDRVQAALERFVNSRVLDLQAGERIGAACISSLTGSGGNQALQMEPLRQAGCPDEVLAIIRHEPVQRLMACQQITVDLQRGAPCAYFEQPWPLQLIRMAAAAVAADAAAMEHLRRLVANVPQKQPLAASLLHATGTGWRPDEQRVPRLAGAYLPGADWRMIHLRGVDLQGADLRRANLQAAVIDKAIAHKVNLSRANLRRAFLDGFRGTEANLAHADLSQVQAQGALFSFAILAGATFEEAVLKCCDLGGVNLTAACFRGADLSQVFLSTTQLQDADFSNARLERANLSGVKLREADFTGACFEGATLIGCDLEDMELPGADFRNAKLTNALLTGSRMPGANFQNACLRNTGLADIHWEGANLGHADMRGATFHMGSSRSGLVQSYIASEGTRTGFYTDDYEEQYFKNPEEIRKANLRGADLRGAVIDDVDFYLVDLRGALYDAEQERHFRRCRAILEDRD